MASLDNVMIVEFQVDWISEPLYAMYNGQRTAESAVREYLVNAYPSVTRRDIIVLTKSQFETIFK